MGALPDFMSKAAAEAGREPLSRAVIKRHQRERVVGVAIEVFAKRGYPGTTVANIVEAAKIGAPTFQSLFGGKEECFLQAYDGIVGAARERIGAALPAGGEWPEQLCAAMRALLELIEEQPLEARIVLVEAQTAGPRALDRYQASLDEVVALLRPGREHAQVPAGELPARLEFATVGGLFWFLQQRVTIGEAAKAAELLPEVMEIVAEPYLGPAATAELLARA